MYIYGIKETNCKDCYWLFGVQYRIVLAVAGKRPKLMIIGVETVESRTVRVLPSGVRADLKSGVWVLQSRQFDHRASIQRGVNFVSSVQQEYNIFDRMLIEC